MKQSILLALLCIGAVSTTADAQLVDREKYPDYSSAVNPDYSLLQSNPDSPIARTKGATETPLPDHVDNSRYKFFPPVFNQDRGSCGSASRICYMFAHELNSYRNADAKLLSNRYPSHFVWLLTFGNSGKNEFTQKIGVPSAETYGGTTYSALFGNQDASFNDFGWMQGYDKWYSAMFNRMQSSANFPINVGSEEGRNAVKRWLYNHNGDNDFQCGGIVGIGVASRGQWHKIPSTPTNNEIGVTGQFYVNKWGTQVDHALTIVGYDDRIEFDLNGNGKKGEESANEKGAWIVVNSWGNTWCNNGFIYCPYAYAGPAFREDGSFPGNFWTPEIYRVRKDYRPFRTIKIKMDYSRRSELCLNVGISSNINADQPDKSIALEHFKYAGDGNNGNTRPAPEVPMLGRWADKKLHTEPMEFGYDLTDLSANFDKNMPLKYFFIIETRDWAEGKGKIYNASIIDYEFEKNGIETPFDINADGVEIKNKGNKTIISTIVYGESYYAPQNLSLQDNKLSWNAPLRSTHKLKSYLIYRDGEKIAEVPAGQTDYTLAEEISNMTFSLSALYEDNTESSKLNVTSPIVLPGINRVTYFQHSGFSIPHVFDSKFNEATIEYWIKPNSICDWNQSAGPGWGTFMMHANSNGAFTAGWSTGAHRANTPAGSLRSGSWTHIAVTVKNNTLKIYINGMQKASVTSTQYSGIGGFGNLVFNAGSDRDNIDARLDEIRIWDYARSAEEIKNNYRVQFSGSVLPSGILAYYKGDQVDVDGKAMLRDYIHGNHAEILKSNHAKEMIDTQLRFTEPSEGLTLNIVPPTSTIYKGLPAKFTTKHSTAVTKLEWTAEDAGINKLQINDPTLTFNTIGEKTVKVVATDENGKTLEKSCVVKVEDTPAADASFTATKSKVSAGEAVTFTSEKPMLGYVYEWSMPGGNVTSSHNVNATTTYSKKGEYTVTLKVTAPDGKTATKTINISVVEVAPDADFEIAPKVIVKGETTFLKDKSKFSPNQWQWFMTNKSKSKIILINGQNTSLTPDVSGIYDVSLIAKNGTGSDKKIHENALIVCNADSKNGLNLTNNGQIELTNVPLTKNDHYITIEWWMNPNVLTNYCDGFGEEDNFEFKVSASGALLAKIHRSKASSTDNFIIPGEWHHYAVTLNNGKVCYYRDGMFIHSSNTGARSLPEVKKFTLGFNNAPMDCHMDEFRIWNKALSIEEIKKYANAPIEDIDKAVNEDKLAVYYNFNQSSGNVNDISGHKNFGIRHNFGPDGDAWGLSRGVFCLNFDNATETTDITAKYLKNCKAPFNRDGQKLVNPKSKPRFGAIADWTLENATTHDDVTTGVHVDNQKQSCFTYTSGWDGFGSITNHKAYQTITLPAGCYEFIADYGHFEGQCGNSYIVVAKGKGLPDTGHMHEAISAKKMEMLSNECKNNSVIFVLSEETEVSLGLVMNLEDKRCCAIQEFKLEKLDAQFVKADGANGYDLTVDATGYNSLYLPYPTVIPENVTAYIAKAINGDEVVLEPIEDGIVPAKTGVIIAANSGKYHFTPSATPSTAKSILTGVTEETATDSDKRYYQIGKQKEVGFYPYNASSLEANHAYLVTDASDTHDSYKLNLVPVGIEQIETEGAASKVYDLSGRCVNNPSKGVYIINGKKVLVK